MHDRFLEHKEMKNIGIINPSQSTVCDICLYEKSTDKLVIVKGDDFSLESYPSSNYSPVGVVVVPGTHNVYGDGSCGVMSLREMNYTSATTGADTYQYMNWGQYETDVSTLTNYDVVCHVGNNGNVSETVQGTNSYAYLPSDRFTTVANPYDEGTGYKYNDNDYYIPSPYQNDGSFNAVYSQTSSPSSAANAMADFDGVGNTKKLVQLHTVDDLSTATTVTNGNGSTYAPSAACCYCYSTDGTKRGDWYLPSCGELGYIVPRFNKINETINALKKAYNVGVQLSSYLAYWSSSEYSSDSARDVFTSDGGVYYDYKRNHGYVRAFLRVKN